MTTTDFPALLDRYMQTSAYDPFVTRGRTPLHTRVTLASFIRRARAQGATDDTMKAALTLAFFKGYTVTLGYAGKVIGADIVKMGFCIRTTADSNGHFRDLDYHHNLQQFCIYACTTRGYETPVMCESFEQAYALLTQFHTFSTSTATICPAI